MSFLRHSDYITENTKKKRFTKACTVKMATYLIQTLEKENERLGGGKKMCISSVRGKKPSKKKASNAFIKFSTTFRPIFVQALKTTQTQGTDVCTMTKSSSKNPSQKVVQKLAAEVWATIPPGVKTVENMWKEYIDQPRVVAMARAITS